MTPTFKIWDRDCITGMAELPEDSVHLVVTSIPFEELFTYSGKPEDVGNNGSTTAVATDGRRLAVQKVTGEAHGGHSTQNMLLHAKDGQRNCVMHRRAARLISDIVKDAKPEQLCKISVGANEFQFTSDGIDIFTSIVEGRFPNYKQVIPTKFNHQAKASPRMLAAAIRRAAFMTDPESKRAICRFAPAKLIIDAAGDDGEAHIPIPIQYEGAGIEVSFDPAFLTDALHAMNPELPVEISIVDATRPATLAQGDFLFIVVPVTESR